MTPPLRSRGPVVRALALFGLALVLLGVPAAPAPAGVDPPRPAAPVVAAEYDLVVVGGTPGGIACAVRAAREGLNVLLVNHTKHLGGMMVNGLLQWDALWDGRRAPLFAEVLARIEDHYRTTYGADSKQYQAARYTRDHYPLGMVEPSVAERVFDKLVAGERRVTVLRGWYPTAVDRQGALLRGVTLKEFDGEKTVTVRAAAFADATYEGDLAALAKVPCRVGREARDEYGEPHAGKVFTTIDRTPAPKDAVEGRLAIRPYSQRQGGIDPKSPHTADGAVQAFNYRFCVTRDPANRVVPDKPPPGYRREEYVDYERKYLGATEGPNGKATMNSPVLPGENHDYPEADWPGRKKIIDRHLRFALGLMYFLQNDESVPEAKRKEFRQWGLCRDEYPDNGHVPYEMYVREARRIVGRHVFTEHDNVPAAGIRRTPVHPDSVAVTDWYMDSHSCTTESRPGFKYDGKLILTEESRPAQVPYRCLLPKGVDNLLVPVCLSATHVAWGAVRLEPVLMQTGEAAGFAAALAARNKTTPAGLDADELVRTLAARRSAVSFFNDVDPTDPAPWVPAVLYFGTKGFVTTYDARPNEPLLRPVAREWAHTFADLVTGKLDPTARAQSLAKAFAGTKDREPVTAAQFAETLTEELAGRKVPAAVAPTVERLGLKGGARITRGDACRLLFTLLGPDAPAPAKKGDPVEADVCVFGGTSGGVVAAVQAARMGKTAVILEPGKHLGGMTSGGLSAVDIGDPRTVGGVAREYFTRLAKQYGKELPWDKRVEGVPTGGAFAVEPHAAEELFDEFVREAGNGVRVLRDARPAAVKKDGVRITEVKLEDGRVVRARMFVDASYEGDLLAKAGVTTIVGREANKQYNETLNGWRISQPPLRAFGPIGPNGRDKSGRGAWMRTIALDPYVEPGQPESGLLPLISPNKMGAPGEAAPGVQAYCYRLCLTDDPANRLPIDPPKDYDPKRYELVARYVAACLKAGDPVDMRWFCMPLALPNKKYDFNTAWVGANLPGAGWGWAEAGYEKRKEIAKAHEDYQRGLLHFLRTDGRVPKNVRDEFARFGLPRDEFKDTGGWPHQLYIREARRMVSDFVMTEHHAYGKKVAPDPVGLASYGVDTHEAQRIAHGGIVVDEGKMMGHGGIPGPYPVGYGAIVPRAAECDNLFGTFCISASHVCFASTRMEPVLMMLSQSAATAACQAIDAGVGVQKVDYEKLRARLLADKMTFDPPPRKPADKPKGKS